MNRATLIGRLGADPQTNLMGDGGMVTNMRVATDESYKNQNGEKVARTEWHRVVAYSKLAEIANDYLKTGRLVLVEGKIRTRKWTDKDNIERYSTEIVATNIKMLDSARKAQEENETHQDVSIDDSVPF